jgi:lipopolysaccharide/colanic/teichoic acid biosynthesis glycosyltransferase
MLEQAMFESILTLERKRAERSGKPFALMLLHATHFLQNGVRGRLLKNVLIALASATRDTDLIGWYEEDAVLGVIFTEIDLNNKDSVLATLHARVRSTLEKQISLHQLKQIAISVYVFPEQVDQNSSGKIADTKFYPELSRQTKRQVVSLAIKRTIDILASGSFLILFLPIFAVIAVVVKLTSKGPVFFKQERMGQFGAPFGCLKFRTMFLNNSPKVHQDFIQNFIKSKDDCAKQGSPNGGEVYKITNDSRVTPIGALLRKTSLDELPQLWNVLVGKMSLVGPRPPVRYEFELYDIWHRRRVFEAKPGITGLWQVSGRSRMRFDEMVRLDLRYSRSWSLSLDLMILLRTPGAVFSGDGAY